MKKNKILLLISLFLIVFFIPQPAHADPISFIISCALTYAASGGIGGVIAGTIIGIGTYSAFVYGVIAIGNAAFSSSQKGNDSASPTYQFGALATQQNNTLAIPIIYGKVKAAGNIIWQSDPTQPTLQRLVSYADGPIQGFYEVKLNDIDINTLSGCNYTAYTGTATQTIDSRVTGSTDLDRVKLAGGLKNLAYLAFTAHASQQLSGNFTSTAIIKGSLVRIYTDLTHFTDGNYSNNPAWCILDFLTRYNGCGLSYDDIDIQSFIDSAAYCDVLISNNLTGTVSTNGTTVTGTNTKFKTEISIDDTITIGNQSRIVTAITDDLTLTVDSAFTTVTNQTAVQKQPRFTLNFILDERKSRLDWIAELCLCCQGGVIYSQGKLVMCIDSPATVMQVFDKDNIIEDSETVNFTTRENRFDIVKVHYPSPVDEYALIYAQAEAEEFQNEQPIVKEIEIYGCTNFRQSSRLAWFYQNQSKTCTQTKTFKTSKAGLDRTIWDLIAISSTFDGTVEKKFRIIGMSEAQEGQIQITGIEYNPDLYTDQQGSAAPVVNYVQIANAYGIPDDVTYFQASQNQNLVQFNWQTIQGVNIVYEIREGASWEASSVIASSLTDSGYSIPLSGLGTKNYWIKAKNKYNYSVNPTQSILVVTDIPQMNVIVQKYIFEEINQSPSDIILDNLATSDGDLLTDDLGNILLSSDIHDSPFVNTYIYNGKLKLNPTVLWQDISPETWQNSGSRYYADILGNWGAKVESSGSYTTQVFDLGDVINSIFSINYDFYSCDDASSYLIEINVSDNNIIGDKWVRFENNKTYLCRYYQFRITLISHYNNPVSFGNCVVSIDVPDRIEHYNGLLITDASAGYVLEFATNEQSKVKKSFSSPPATIITPKAQTGIIQVPEYSDKTKDSVTIRLKDASTGAFIIGEFDCVVKGY